jgi:hypothetical protein
MTEVKKISLTELTKFGHGIGLFINDRDLVVDLQIKLGHFFKPRLLHPPRKFVGALPVALTRKNLHLLRTKSLITQKCDANNSVFKLPNGENKTIEDLKIIHQKSINQNLTNQNLTNECKNEYKNGEENNLKLLTNPNIFYVKRKTDGERYYLMFDSRDHDKTKIAYQVMFDRKLQPILVKFLVPEYFHEDTLLDGELVQEPNGTYSYYLIDVIKFSGFSTMDFKLRDRQLLLSYIANEIKQCPERNESPCFVKSKRCMPINKLDEFLKLENLEYLRNSKKSGKIGKEFHPCDGLVFEPSECGVLLGTATEQIKWKEPLLCTNEFLIQQVSDSDICFYVENERGMLLFKTQSIIETFDKSKLNNSKLDEELNYFKNKIVECWYDTSNALLTNPAEWIIKPKKIRLDKLKPNFITTVIDTIQSIQDNITIDDIINEVNK